LAKGTESLSDIVYGLWQRSERMELIAQSLMLRGGAALIVTPICFVVSHTVWVAVCGMAIAWALVLIVFDIPYACIIASNTGQPIIPRFGASTMKRLISLSLPLGIVTMLQSFSSNIPRYLIGQIRGVHELGLFSAPAYVLLAGSMTVNALAQSAIPRLAFYHSQGNLREFRNLSNQLILIGLGLGAAGVLVAASFGRQILTAIYGRDYAHNSELFVLLMAAAAPGYMASFAGYSLTAARHFRIQMPIFGLVTAVTIVLSYLMVKSDGATGAARALAIATLVQFLLTYGMMRHMDSYKN
jgi:O-antigen/teichoic acid export membrane protein